MSAPQKIAVAGATGRVGRHVVDVLRERGHDVVPMARSLGVDVITGEGLDAALEGVECVVDAATGPSPDQQEAAAFFTTAARNLHAAGERAGVRRVVEISIIGIDRLTAGYGAAKVAHERAMLAGPIPVHIVRAAQFHEFVEQLLDWSTQGDVANVPPMRVQPVAARALAEVLADLATASGPAAPAAGATTEVAGPRAENLAEIAAQLAARRGHPLKVEAVSNVDDPDREVNEGGGLLPGPDARLVGPTFAAWLDSAS